MHGIFTYKSRVGSLLGGSSQLVSPLSRVVPFPNGHFMAYKWGLLTIYDTWDDPPSRG